MSKYKNGLVPPQDSPLWDEIREVGWDAWIKGYYNSPEFKESVQRNKEQQTKGASENLVCLMDSIRGVCKDNGKLFVSTKVTANYCIGKGFPEELVELETALNSMGRTLSIKNL